MVIEWDDVGARLESYVSENACTRGRKSASRRAEEYERSERRARRRHGEDSLVLSAASSVRVRVRVECTVPNAECTSSAREFGEGAAAVGAGECGARERESRAESVRDKPPRADAVAVAVAVKPLNLFRSVTEERQVRTPPEPIRRSHRVPIARNVISHITSHHMHCAPRMTCVPTWRLTLKCEREHLKYSTNEYECTHMAHCMHPYSIVPYYLYTRVSGSEM